MPRVTIADLESIIFQQRQDLAKLKETCEIKQGRINDLEHNVKTLRREIGGWEKYEQHIIAIGNQLQAAIEIELAIANPAAVPDPYGYSTTCESKERSREEIFLAQLLERVRQLVKSEG